MTKEEQIKCEHPKELIEWGDYEATDEGFSFNCKCKCGLALTEEYRSIGIFNGAELIHEAN